MYARLGALDDGWQISEMTATDCRDAKVETLADEGQTIFFDQTRIQITPIWGLLLNILGGNSYWSPYLTNHHNH